MACLTCNKFFCLDLKVAAIICAYLFATGKMVIVGFDVNHILQTLDFMNVFGNGVDLFEEKKAHVMKILIKFCLHLLLMIADTILAIVAIVGLHEKRKTPLLRIFYIGAFFTFLLNLCLLTHTIVQYYATGINWQYISIEFVFHRVLSLLCILIIRSYYHKLKNQREEDISLQEECKHREGLVSE